MWILLIITTLGNDPPRYEYTTYAATKTMTECINILKKMPRTLENQEHYCLKAK